MPEEPDNLVLVDKWDDDGELLVTLHGPLCSLPPLPVLSLRLPLDSHLLPVVSTLPLPIARHSIFAKPPTIRCRSVR